MKRINLVRRPIWRANLRVHPDRAGNRTAETDRICGDCWDRAFSAFATAKIFASRSRKYRKLVNTLAFLGIGVPAIFGCVIMAYGYDFSGYKFLLTVALAIGIIQVGVSCTSIIGDWSGELEYSHESSSENFALSEQFKNLAQTAPNPDIDLKIKYQNLIIADQARNLQDYKREVTSSELSRGHREGLIQFRRKCATCGIEPKDVRPTSCITCGNFTDG